MSAPFIIPFNFQPASSVIVKNASTSEFSTSYTVPEGKYAYVKDHFGGLAINGAFTNLFNTFSAGFNVNQNSSYDYGKFSGVNARVHVNYSGTTAGSYSRIYTAHELGSGGIGPINLIADRTGGGNPVYQSLSGVTYLRAVMNRTTSGTVSHNIYLFSTQTFEGWVPTGTVLDGIHYTVTEYNMIS